MIALLSAIFVASLAGSLHCAGMCGGIVTLCVSGRAVMQRRRWTPQVHYNLGRLVTYASLGGISGALGAAIDFGGAAAGWTRTAMMLAGAVIVLAGVIALARTFGLQIPMVRTPAALRGAFGKAFSWVRRMPPAAQPLLVGLLTGLLPCGWLYAFVIAAAGTGSPLLGALTMIVFWAGTVPVMLGIGVGVQQLSTKLRPLVPRLTAVALIVLGIVTVFNRLSIPAYAGNAASIPAAADLVDHVHTTHSTEPPCCDDQPVH